MLSILLILMFITGVCRANNISVSNSTGIAGNPALLRFDVNWDNSWRVEGDTLTWDAAWLFVKYRCLNNNDTWWHLKLNDTGHTAPSGSELALGKPDEKSAWDADTNPYVGAFLHRDSGGTGSVSYTGVELAFNLADNNLVSSNTIDTRVFAIEMVYISTGSFYAGDGGTGSGLFRAGNTANSPFLIDYDWSENSGYGTYRRIENISNALWAENFIDVDTLNADYPTGYGSFYMMKYEITQGQYVDFLNTLMQTQATPRKETSSDNRYAITGSAVGSYATTKPYVALNCMNWADGTAYAAWSGLRPFTELEYEKACRGPLSAVADEYAWGTDTVADSVYTISNDGAANEGIATNYSATAGNASYETTDGSINGPLRVGIFAANAGNTGRVSAGASYWGIMQLSGNLYERPVTVGNANGRLFTGLHGNGVLTSTGIASVTNWPAPGTASGAGYRGCAWLYSSSGLRVNVRTGAASTNALRSICYGFRAVRSAPVGE